MLYTRKGDNGTTKTFDGKERISKSSAVTEALGSLDEANSYLGIVKSKIDKEFTIDDAKIIEIIGRVQNDIFIIQAQVAGADKNIENEKIVWLEELVNEIEKELPPITTFLIPGANEISAKFDYSRTLVRRAERRTVAASEDGITKISLETLSYLNRLSSLMYALARYSAHKLGNAENSPTY